MSNKTQLQTNHTALDGFIARINTAKETAASLPEAGGESGGGSVETWTGTVTVSMMDECTVSYTDKNCELQEEYIGGPGNPTSITIEIIKNSLICLDTYNAPSATQNCEKWGGGYGTYVYKITGDNFIMG